MPRPRANWDSVGFHGGSRGPHPERAGGSPDGRATAGGEKKNTRATGRLFLDSQHLPAFPVPPETPWGTNGPL